MTTFRAFIKRHPLLSFYGLAFAISWGGILLAVGLGPGGFSATPLQFQKAAIPYAVLAMVLGPSVVGILLTGLVHGREGLREFRSRLLRWRVGARWYAVALLTAPLVFAAVFVPLWLISPEFLPRIFITSDKASVVLMGIAAGLMAGIFEELGWTGFATPTLLRRMRYGVLTTGLIVGVLWGVAHFPLYYWQSADLSGVLLPAVVAANVLAWFPPYRVLMVWVYERTESLLVAMLMHGSATGSLVIFASLAPGWDLFTYCLVFGAVLWVVVGGVALVQGGRLTRHPLSRRRVA